MNDHPAFYCREFPYQPDAAAYFCAIADLPRPVWLDSGGMARFDILTAAPHHTLIIEHDSDCDDPFERLRREIDMRVSPVENIPFAGGALGYWSYDLARKIPTRKMSNTTPPNLNKHPDDSGIADMEFGIYDWALVLDHQLKTARLVSHQRYPETASLLTDITARLQNPAPIPSDDFRVHGKINCNFTPATYAEAFATVQHYLHDGDCYQVNLAQRFQATASGHALAAYLRLRSNSPAPYSAFLDFPSAQILCASPERFISVHNGLVETKPIKGTRPRHPDPQRDQQLADELKHHPKDRAENLMIVDLLRNDLGKTCKPGTVRVPALFDIESYANVHHLVSTVQGELADGCDALHVMHGSFPGGSITGAPKRRAMQIIEQLEPNPRGLYCGAIGYIGYDGNMDSNIVIRTLVYANHSIRCWAGGGLVADSQCDAEYQETLDKARAMLEFLQNYGGVIETDGVIG